MAKPMQDCVVMLGDSITQENKVPRNLYERLSRIGLYAKTRRPEPRIRRVYHEMVREPMVPLFDEIFAQKKDGRTAQAVRLVTIWLGTNDSVHDIKAQHVPIEDFENNMNTMLSWLTSPSSPYAVADTPVSIVLITPGPPCFSQMGDGNPTFRSTERTRQFRDAVLKIGQEWRSKGDEAEKASGVHGWRVGVVDVWGAFEVAAGGLGDGIKPFLTDGLHFSSAGYDLVWQELARVIRTDFAGRGLDWEDEDDLPHRVPWWADLSPEDPRSAVDRMLLPRIRGGSGGRDWKADGLETYR